VKRRDFIVAASAGSTLLTAAPLAAQPGAAAPSRVPVIDVHTHMFSRGWMEAAWAASDPHFALGRGAQEGALIYSGASIGQISPPMLDYDLRIKAMDEAHVDIALISLTAPNVYWGTKADSVKAARVINDDFRAAAQRHEGRIRWMASLPWQYADEALAELRRARQNGAIGICMLTSIRGTPLIDAAFRPIWREIEAMALPVFIHPTKPEVNYIGEDDSGLFNSIGFTTDTSLCFARMINSGFLDAFPKLNLIACHGGGYLPFLAARLDRIWEKLAGGVRHIPEPPSHYLKRLWFDSIVYDQPTLEFLVRQVGPERILYGSDFPFLIGDMKGVLARVDALPGEQRDAIRGQNHHRLFDL
jgi:aminocarboxymuconate-semialdehyde decarboxylase